MISVPQNQDRSVTVPLEFDGEDYLPPVGTTFQFLVLRSQTDLDADALFEKETGDGLTVVASRFLQVDIDAADTVDLDVGQPYVYEIRAYEPLSAPVIVVGQGRLFISPSPRAEVVPPPSNQAPPPFSVASIESLRGDTLHLLVYVTLQGVPLSLVGGKLYFTLKTTTTDVDGSALLSKETDAGIEILDEVGGQAVVVLTAAETLALALDTVFYWDIQLKTSLAEIFTLARGTLVFVQHVTQRTT